MTDKYRSTSLQTIQNEKRDLKSICFELLQLNLDEKVYSHVLFGKSKIFAKDEYGKIIDELLYRWYEKKKEFALRIIYSIKKYLMRKQIFAGLKRIALAIKCFIKLQAIARGKQQRVIFKRIVLATKRMIALQLRCIKKVYFSHYKFRVNEIRIAAAIAAEKRAAELAAKKRADAIEAEKRAAAIESEKRAASIEAQKRASLSAAESKQNMEESVCNSYQLNESNILNQSISNETLEKINILESYSSVSNYNTNNRSMNQNEIYEANNDILTDYDSAHKEEQKKEMKEKYEEIQRKNKEIMNDDVDAGDDEGNESKDANQIKINSKFERFLDLTKETSMKPPPPSLSEDGFIDFTGSNQKVIEYIQNHDFLRMCANVLEIRKKSNGEPYTIKERISYQNTPITKPLTHLPKHHEPAAIKSFQYILKYGGDMKHTEVHRRVIGYKLLRHLLNQDEQEVTDEIFLQLVKQLNNNTSISNLEKYFQICALVASSITLSDKISFSCLNFFYNQSNLYHSKNKERFEQWCKYILLRVGNCLGTNGAQEWQNSLFKRNEIPLKEEFQAIEKMRIMWQPVYFYHNQLEFFKIESYSTISILIKNIGLQMEAMKENQNWYGIVEYITIGDKTETQILDFNIRILDWKANRQRQKQQHLKMHPGVKYDIRLYYQTVVPNSVDSTNIDTILMMYSTSVNEFIYGIYFFDSLNQVNVNEIEFIVEMAAIKFIADYKIYKKGNLKILNCVPECKASLLQNLEDWKAKIYTKCKSLLSHLTSQRKARSYFLERMKFFQGKFFMTQKFYCKYSKIGIKSEDKQNEAPLNEISELVSVVVMCTVGYAFILMTSSNKEIEQLSFRDINKFSLNLQQHILQLHTEQYFHSLVAPNSLILYFNIDFYINLINELGENSENVSFHSFHSTPPQELTLSEKSNNYSTQMRQTEKNSTENELIQNNQKQNSQIKQRNTNKNGLSKMELDDHSDTDNSKMSLNENLL